MFLMFAKRKIMIAASAAALAMLASVTAASAAPPRVDSHRQIRVQDGSNRCLDAAMPTGWHTEQFDLVNAWACQNGGPFLNQGWGFHPVNDGSGAYTITNDAADPKYGSGLCLDMPWPEVPSSPHAHGKQLALYPCSGSWNQEWYISNGGYFVNRLCDADYGCFGQPGLVMDASGAGTGNTKVVMWQPLNGANQAWGWS
jgi:hypothetical protein